MVAVVVATVVLAVVGKGEGMIVRWHEESITDRVLKRDKGRTLGIDKWQRIGKERVR